MHDRLSLGQRGTLALGINITAWSEKDVKHRSCFDFFIPRAAQASMMSVFFPKEELKYKERNQLKT